MDSSADSSADSSTDSSSDSSEPKVSQAPTPKKSPMERLHQVDEHLVAELLSIETILNHAERHAKLVKCKREI